MSCFTERRYINMYYFSLHSLSIPREGGRFNRLQRSSTEITKSAYKGRRGLNRELIRNSFHRGNTISELYSLRGRSWVQQMVIKIQKQPHNRVLLVSILWKVSSSFFRVDEFLVGCLLRTYILYVYPSILHFNLSQIGN